VSTMNAASLRALLYARSLGFADTTAVYFSFEEDDASSMRRAWQRFPTGLPLEVIEAPYRDLGRPLLTYLREITSDPEAVAVVVGPSSPSPASFQIASRSFRAGGRPPIVYSTCVDAGVLSCAPLVSSPRIVCSPFGLT